MTHARAVSLMILVTFLWSIAGVVTRHLEDSAPFALTFWRSLFTALALSIGLTFLRGPGLWRNIARWPRATWISGLCWAVMFTAFMVALTLTTVANVLVTMASGPLLTALLAMIFLGHRVGAATWCAIVVAGIGIAWMFGSDAGNGQGLAGILVALAVPLAAAINWTLLQHIAERGDGENEDMLPAVWVGAVLSAAATLPLAQPLGTSLHDLSLLALLGSVQLAIPCLLVVRLARVLPGPEISLLALLEVIFGVAWAWIGAGEQPSAGALVGGGLVLAALAGNELLARKAR